MRTRSLSTPALALATALAGCRPTVHADLLLSNVDVIDVRAGQLIRGRDVLVDGNHISHIFPHDSERVIAPAILDGHERYVMPGLWDMHAHIRTYEPSDVLPMFIANGVTGIRDLGLTSFPAIQQWQRDINEGSLVGPRIISSGVIIEGRRPVFPSSISIGSSKEIAPKLDSLVARGIAIIKIFDDVPGPVFKDIVAYARQKGLPSAGHIPDEWDQIQAANSGLRSIEHFWGLEKTLSYKDRRLDARELDRLAEVLRSDSTFECPTLINGSYTLVLESLPQHPELEQKLFMTDSALTYSPAYFRAWWDRIRKTQSATLTAQDYSDMRTRGPFAQAAARELSARGVRFLAGTDTPNPYLPAGESLHEELVQLAHAGIGPAEVLRTATLYPAEFFGRTADLGLVAVGHLADLLVLDRNPLTNIANTTSIHAVIANGRLFSTQDIAGLKRAQLQHVSQHVATDLDQVIYMEVRRNGIAGARRKFSNPLRDSTIVAKPQHLVRLSGLLAQAGERDQARQALEWNLELFPGDTATLARLAALSSAGPAPSLHATSH
jgi:amidohydrolase family protein